jgi:predicted acetyltransferase
VPLDVRPFRPDDADAVHRLAMRAFSDRPGTPRDPERPAVEDDRRLVAELDGRVVGHLGAWALGQWFGGRRVPVAGISAVTVAPEVRGRGVGRALVRAGLDAAHGRGEPLATLFPLTRAVYRRAGFELAGAHPRARVTTAALASLDPPGDDVEVVPGGEDDVDAMLALDREAARLEPGGLDRPRTFAMRALRPDEHGFCVLARRAGELVGYVVYEHGASERDRPAFFQLDVLDLVAADADARRALLRVLGSHASGAATVSMTVAPEDPLELWLPEQAWSAPPVAWRWMTRLVDPSAAVAARGWPAGVEVTAHLDVSDPTWPDRGGAWTFTLADGHAQLSRGGPGTVAVDVGALASWFTGYRTASSLAAYGRLRGADGDTLRALDAATAGPTPWVRAFF